MTNAEATLISRLVRVAREEISGIDTARKHSATKVKDLNLVVAADGPILNRLTEIELRCEDVSQALDHIFAACQSVLLTVGDEE